MVPASPGPPMTTILAGMAPTRPPGRAIPIAGARKTTHGEYRVSPAKTGGAFYARSS
jgi:hypothetical protein